jgi:hypothetical protein
MANRMGTTERTVPRGGSGAGLVVLGTLTLLAGAAPVAHADPAPELAKYAGNYKYGNTKEHALAIVDKAMDEALSQLNTVMRLIVKKAMEGRTKTFIETILIDLPGNKIAIKLGELDKVSVEPGKSETVKSEDGKQTSKVTHQFDGSKIVQTFTGENGALKNVFQLAGDGKTLHRDVTITSDRLQKPIKYRLTYVRK